MKSNEKPAVHQLQCITCSALPSVHHLQRITCGASPATHHLRRITWGTSHAVLHLRCITCSASPWKQTIWIPGMSRPADWTKSSTFFSASSPSLFVGSPLNTWFLGTKATGKECPHWNPWWGLWGRNSWPSASVHMRKTSAKDNFQIFSFFF